DRARRAAFAAHGLQLGEFDVLAALRRQGPPYRLSPGALLRATLVTSGTMTNRLDRLEQAGLVRRAPDPEDKRGVLVSLTAAGGAGQGGRGPPAGRPRRRGDAGGAYPRPGAPWSTAARGAGPGAQVTVRHTPAPATAAARSRA